MKTFLFKTSLFTVIFLILASFFGGMPATVEAAPKPTKTLSPANTPRPTNTRRPTNTPRFTFTPTLTSSATASAMPSPTATFTNTPTLTFTPTDLPTETPTATASPTDMPAEPNLLTYWKFDEGIGNTVADSSGNGHTLQLNGTWWTDISAPTTFSNPFAINLPLLFDVDAQYASSTGIIDLANKSFSLAVWAKRGQFDRGGIILSQGIVGTDQLLYIKLPASGTFTCGFGNDDLETSVTTSDGDWHHYVCTYDAVSNIRKAYRDGALVGSDHPLGSYVGAGAVLIGESFNGRIDDVRIYNAALSDAQAAALAQVDENYNPPPCAVQPIMYPPGGLKLPQSLQLAVYEANNCDVTYTYMWGCGSDTSFECPNFVASANIPPYDNYAPRILIQEDDSILVWVNVCVAGTSNCSPPTNCSSPNPINCVLTSPVIRIYEGARVN